MNDIRKLAHQTAIYGAGTIVPRVLNYAVLTLFYTYIFSTKEYGVVTELYAWMVLAMIILTYGMETAYFRFVNKEKDPDAVFSTSLYSLFFTSATFLILVTVFIKPVSAFLNYSNNPEYIKMFAWIVAIDAFSAIPFAYLRSHNRPIVFSVLKIINVAVTIVVVYFFLKIAPEILKGGGNWVLKVYNPDFGVGYVFLSNLIGSAVTLVFLTPFIIKIKPVFSKGLLYRMLSYSWPLLVGGLAGSFNDVLDKIILRRMIGGDAGLSTVGVYGAGYKVAVLMAIFIQMYRFAAEPFFFERAERKDAKETYSVTMKYFVIVSLMLYLVINLYIDAAQVIIGPKFRESLSIVPIVSMGYFLFGIFINQSIWYKIKDKTIYGVYLTLIGVAITVSVNVVFIPRFGYVASAWAHIACYLAMVIVSFMIGKKHYPVKYDIKGMILYTSLAIILVAVSKLLKMENVFMNIMLNTALLGIFVFVANKKDKVIGVFLKRK